jgi:hypothetical protein
MQAQRLFSFPNPVNEVAARTVAGCVAVIGVVAIVAHLPWLSAVLAAGFLARVASGPTLSPLGQLATRVIAPRLGLPPSWWRDRPSASPKPSARF